MQLAAYNSEDFHRFIILSSGAPRGQELDPHLRPDSPVQLWEGETDPSLFFPDTDKGNAALCRYIKLYRAMPKNAITKDEVITERRALEAAIKKSDIYDRLGDILNPTLTVVGTKQGEGHYAYELLEKMPTAMLIGYSDAAHAVSFQYALPVGQAIAEFLDSDIDSPEARCVQTV